MGAFTMMTMLTGSLAALLGVFAVGMVIQRYPAWVAMIFVLGTVVSAGYAIADHVGKDSARLRPVRNAGRKDQRCQPMELGK